MSRPFDVRAALPAAWDLLWKDRLARRLAGNDFRGDTYYLTASDLEAQVRRFAREDLDGVPRGSTGPAWGREAGVRISGDVSAIVRSWLLSNPRIVGHNFLRGHISGMRFRPYGEPIGPAEKTIEAKERRLADPKPPPLHFARGDGPLCTFDRCRSRFRRSRTWRTGDASRVTCPACLKKLAAPFPGPPRP